MSSPQVSAEVVTEENGEGLRLPDINETMNSNMGESTVYKEAMSKLTKDQIQDFLEAFEIFDKDGDGTISVSELGIVLRSLGQNPSDEEIEEMIKAVDKDGNGHCERDEFLLLMSKQLDEEGQKGEAVETFKAFDSKN